MPGHMDMSLSTQSQSHTAIEIELANVGEPQRCETPLLEQTAGKQTKYATCRNILKHWRVRILGFILLWLLVAILSGGFKKTANNVLKLLIGLCIGATVCAAILRHPVSHVPPRTVRNALAILVLSTTLFVSLYPLIPGTQPGSSWDACVKRTRKYYIDVHNKTCKRETCKDNLDIQVATQAEGDLGVELFRIVLYFVTYIWGTGFAITCLLREHPPSRYARNSVLCVCAIWLLSFVRIVRQIAKFCGTSKNIRLVMFLTSNCLSSLCLAWPAVLISQRIESLQAAMSRDLNTNFLRRIVLLVILLCVIQYVVEVMELSDLFLVEERTLEHTLQWLETSVRIVLLLGYGFCARTYMTPLRFVIREADIAQGVARLEALWAARILKLELSVVLLCAASKIFCALGTLLKGFDSYEDVRGRYFMLFTATLPLQVELSVYAASVAVLSGILSSYEGHSIYSITLSEPRTTFARAPRSTFASFALEETGHSDVWHEKVEDLANRGVRLGDLLDFYDRLGGDMMPHFDPMRSTTNEVVRLSIIPASVNETGYGGRALATVMNKGQKRLATRMVTHGWSNLFSHLIAAVICDAFGIACFEDVGKRLRSRDGVQGLKSELENKKLLDIAYWICAFSINQHSSICAGLGPEPGRSTGSLERYWKNARDHVTGEEFPLCSCGEIKHLNDSSDLCEMNKFDAMIRFLCKTIAVSDDIESFRQVIAVDKEFEVFERAWCVAEIAVANELQIPQHVKILSHSALEDKYFLFANFAVEDCKASRREDKELILSMIDDLSTFNRHLQFLLFSQEGLLGSWMDGSASLMTAGVIVARALRRPATPDVQPTKSYSIYSW